jgi:hypothetical protein
MRPKEKTEEGREKARARRKREKQKRWDQGAEARRERAMWAEIRAALDAGAAEGVPGADDPTLPLFFTHWETWDRYRRQWKLFATEEEAKALANELRQYHGYYVYGVRRVRRSLK